MPEPTAGGDAARRRTLAARLGPLGSAVRHRAARWYGEGPLQLVLLLASFAVAAYAGIRLVDGADSPFSLVLWFVGAALLHDLVLVPLYGLADRALQFALGRGVHERAPRRERANARRWGVDRRWWLNHLRVPALLSLLLLLVYYPLISGTRAAYYEAATALPGDVFLPRWLLITAGLFALSALWLLLRVVLRRRRATKGRPSTTH